MKVYDFNKSKVVVKVINTVTPNRIELYDAKDMEPFLVATSNIPTLNNVEGYVAVKDYSENEGILNFLIENNFVEPPITFVRENLVNFPICKLK